MASAFLSRAESALSRVIRGSGACLSRISAAWTCGCRSSSVRARGSEVAVCAFHAELPSALVPHGEVVGSEPGDFGSCGVELRVERFHAHALGGRDAGGLRQVHGSQRDDGVVDVALAVEPGAGVSPVWATGEKVTGRPSLSSCSIAARARARVACRRSSLPRVRNRVLSVLVIAGLLGGAEVLEGGDDLVQAGLDLAEVAGETEVAVGVGGGDELGVGRGLPPGGCPGTRGWSGSRGR